MHMKKNKNKKNSTVKSENLELNFHLRGAIDLNVLTFTQGCHLGTLERTPVLVFPGAVAVYLHVASLVAEDTLAGGTLELGYRVTLPVACETNDEGTKKYLIVLFKGICKTEIFGGSKNGLNSLEKS